MSEPRFTQERLLRCHDMLTAEAKGIIKEKNDAYAGADDLWRNFSGVEKLGLATTEQGILIRASDKFNRLVTFVMDGEDLLDGNSITTALSEAARRSSSTSCRTR